MPRAEKELQRASSDVAQLRQRRKSRRDPSRGRQATPALVGIPVTLLTAPSMRTLSRLFSHFTQSGPMWMSIGPGGRRQTCFLSQVVPIAMQSPPVLSCIFAAAATDLAKYNGGKDGLEVFALEMHSRALGEVNDAVSQEIISDTLAGVDGRSADALLLAVLLLCFHETHNFSDNSRLIPHLNAAATLSWRCLQRPPANIDLRNFLIDLFCYFFALAAFSHGESLLSEPASRVFARVLAASQQDDMLLLGPGQQLLAVIFRVSTLAMHAPTALESKSRRFELMHAERNLQYWQISDPTAREALRIPSVPYEGTAEGLSHGSSTDNNDDDAGPDRMRIFEIYRLACLLFVRRTLYPHAPLCGADVQDIISSVVAQVHLLPESSPANGVLVWPLVVVGVCSLDDVHQRAITARLRTIYRTWRSDILRRNIEFLWAHWRHLRCARRNRHSTGPGPACRSPGNNGHACCAGGGARNFTFQGLGLPTILV
ncbi:fungal-specific transcription factor domain-containing protein [Aspergillus germanicus]